MSECLSVKLPVHWYLALMEGGLNETPCWSSLVSLLFSSGVCWNKWCWWLSPLRPCVTRTVVTPY